MNNTSKRTYKHYEAWLAKAAVKAAAKKEAKKVEKKPMKKAKKANEKTLAVKAEAKKLAAEKKLAKIAAKKQEKDFMKQAKKLFDATKKSVSATKKQTKAYGKLVSEALKAGDAKTLEKVLKLFSRIGYSKLGDDAIIENIFAVKVKIPKVKKAKEDSDVSKKPRVKKAKGNDETAQAETQSSREDAIADDGPEAAQDLGSKDLDSTVVEPASPDQADSFSDEELISTEKELDDNDPDIASEEDDEEAVDDVDDSRDEPDMFDQSGIRNREEAFREMEEAQCDNGDWDS